MKGINTLVKLQLFEVQQVYGWFMPSSAHLTPQKNRLSLRDKFKDNMTEDHRWSNSTCIIYLNCRILKKILLDHWLHSPDLGLPDPGPIHNEVQFQANQEATEAIVKIGSLKNIHKTVFKEFTAAVEIKPAKQRCFLDRPGAQENLSLQYSIYGDHRNWFYLLLRQALQKIN